MKGYKAFHSDWTCRGKQYKVGETFTEDGNLEVCKKGMHFCERLPDVFKFYHYDPEHTKVAEVEAIGDIATDEDGVKSCTSKLQIVREIPWEEVQKACNTGCCNAGARNTGNWNTGNWNAGNWNTGNWNAGNWNAGARNAGDCNAGDCNTGNWNTGKWNAGDCNTGDWNKSSHNNGCFMTIEPKIMLFNKPSEWTYADWSNSRACMLMSLIPRTVWVRSREMTDEEKNAHPEHEATGGYLKMRDCAQEWWNDLPDADRKEIMSLPNFDAEIFYECTGIRI